MVTVKLKSFADFKEYITNLGMNNPNRVAPYRFHSISGNNTVNKIAEIYAGGTVVILYDSPTGESISPNDDWFKAHPEMHYPASIVVLDVGESIQ